MLGNLNDPKAPPQLREMEDATRALVPWGTEYPEETRNGEWEYRVFRADKIANPDTKYDGCFGYHKSQESQEYMFTFDSLKVASR
jgi:hypothetical protein